MKPNTEMLDWLEKALPCFDYQKPDHDDDRAQYWLVDDDDKTIATGPTLRDAIDDAMKKELAK